MPSGKLPANPPPPIRTDTSASAPATYLPTPRSAVTSPATTCSSVTTNSSSSSKPPSTPAERSFFGALAHNIRERSRSRSRVRQEAARPPPPSTASGPTSSPATPTSPDMSPRASRYARPHAGVRQSSEASTASSASASTAKRTSTTSSEVSFQKFSYGRHSNDWLFNGFSVKDTARTIFRRSSHDE